MDMKGKTILAVVLGMQLLAAYPAAGAAEAKPAAPAHAPILVNGQKAALQKAPILVQQRTYITAEDVSRLLQAGWTRNGNTGVLAFAGKRTYTFQLDSGKVAVNGKWVQAGQGAILRDQQVYLPLRWIVEQVGHEIKWNAEAKAVEIIAELEEGGLTLIAPDQLTEQEKAYVDSVSRKKGIHQQGNLYVIARGQSPNPGYGLQVTSTEWSWEQLIVYVKLTKPEPGIMYPQVVTYPYLVAKADLPPYTTVVFLDADTKKPLFAQ
jgi:hypothetical protein